MTHIIYPFYCTVFSNILKDTQLHMLADSDEHEVVQQLQVCLDLSFSAILQVLVSL